MKNTSLLLALCCLMVFQANTMDGKRSRDGEPPEITNRSLQKARKKLPADGSKMDTSDDRLLGGEVVDISEIEPPERIEALALYKLKKYSQAAIVAQKLIDRSPENLSVDDFILLANSLKKACDHARAAKAYLSVKAHPSTWETPSFWIIEEMVEAYIKAGDIFMAAQEIKASLSYHPEEVPFELCSFAGLYLTESGAYDEAYPILMRAIDLSKGWTPEDIYYSLMRCMVKESTLDKAFHYADIISYSVKVVDLAREYEVFASSCRIEERYAIALLAYSVCIKLYKKTYSDFTDKKFLSLFRNFAICHQMKGDYKKAHNYAESLVNLFPNDATDEDRSRLRECAYYAGEGAGDTAPEALPMKRNVSSGFAQPLGFPPRSNYELTRALCNRGTQ